MFGQAQSIDARLKGGVLETAFGDWPLNCLSRDAGGAEALTLVFRSDAIQVEPAEEGYTVRELRLQGADDVLHIDSGDGATLSARMHRPHSIEVGATVRLRPLKGHVFPVPA